MSKLQEMLEQLYDLDRSELRHLVWEALLISDGPDRIGGPVDSTVSVQADSMTFHVSSESW